MPKVITIFVIKPKTAFGATTYCSPAPDTGFYGAVEQIKMSIINKIARSTSFTERLKKAVTGEINGTRITQKPLMRASVAMLEFDDKLTLDTLCCVLHGMTLTAPFSCPVVVRWRGKMDNSDIEWEEYGRVKGTFIVSFPDNTLSLSDKELIEAVRIDIRNCVFPGERE